MFRPPAIAIVATLFLNVASFATTSAKPYAVGNCAPNLQSYPSISVAVSSVPAGSTVLVCPGNYPEQVLITQALTLKGVLVGGSDAAVVTVPSGGLSQSVTDHFGNTVFYQILVQNTAGPVNITNLGVDGTGASAPGGFLAGIFYYEASGTLSSVTTRNQTSSTQSGDAILAQSFGSAQTLTVQSSSVRGFDGGGISAFTDLTTPLLTATIKGNHVRGNDVNGTGIFLDGATGTVQSNIVTDASEALGLVGSAATVTANTLSGVSANPLTVYIQSGSNTLKGNKIDAAGGYGVQLVFAGTNVIELNTIVDSSTAVYGCYNSVSGNTVTGNTIIDAGVGVSLPSGNTFHPNIFSVVGTAVATCSG